MTTTTVSTDDPTRAGAPGSPASWRRSHAAAGFAFAALEIGCIAIQGGAAPSRHASSSSIGAFFRDHATNVRLSEIFAAFGLAALLWWFGGLWELITTTRERMSGVVAVAGVGFAVGVSLVLVDISLFGTAGVASRVLDDGSLALLFHASTAAILVSGIGTAAFLAATCIISMRSRLFAPWTNYLGLTTAVAFLLGAVGVGDTSDVLLATGYLASMGLCVWTVAVSVTMWRAR
jgi:hypothetical protein